jgi:hypothetical protein
VQWKKTKTTTKEVVDELMTIGVVVEQSTTAFRWIVLPPAVLLVAI